MQSRSGFTIVELLIVVVVVAILAAISLIAYSSLQTRTRVSAIVSDLEATHKALDVYRTMTGNDKWWIDTSPYLTNNPSGNPRIHNIISMQPEFSKLLTTPPSKEGLNTTQEWFYDNDGDTYSSCGGSGYAGVNFQISGVSNPSLMQAIDDTVDDGDLTCDNVRTTSSGTTFVYGISDSS